MTADRNAITSAKAIIAATCFAIFGEFIFEVLLCRERFLGKGARNQIPLNKPIACSVKRFLALTAR
jgi:hypothetical protein